MAFEAVRENLARVREEIARIQCAVGTAHPVRIVGVTKGHPAEAISAAAAAGLEDVGENRVKEALAKRDRVGGSSVCWHLIGHLQTNKAKYVPGNFSVVHSVDSLKVAEALARATSRVAEGGIREPLRVLVQVNVSHEAQKSGCPPSEVSALAHRVAAMPELSLQGLMTMAPLTGDEARQRRAFSALRELRDGMEAEGLRLPELSMGMSGDYPAAVAEGSTMIRLGTVLFGER